MSVIVETLVFFNTKKYYGCMGGAETTSVVVVTEEETAYWVRILYVSWKWSFKIISDWMES